MLVASCCVLLTLAAAALAAGRWSKPERISGGDDDVLGQRIALNRAGTVAWFALDGDDVKLRVATRGPRGKFADPQTLGKAALTKGSHLPSRPAVGVDGNGKATVAWTRPDADGNLRIVVASQHPNGSFSAPETISGPGVDAFQPQIAVNDAGEAVVVWQSGDGPFDIREATRDPDAQQFGSSIAISDPDGSAEFAAVGLSDAGRTIVIWLNTSVGRPHIDAVSRAAGASDFSAPQALSEPASDTSPPQLAVAGNGAAIAAWEEGNAKDVAGIGWAFAPAADPFQPGQFVRNREDRGLRHVSVGIDGRGTATLLWGDDAEVSGKSDDTVRVARSREGGDLSSEVLDRDVEFLSSRVAVSGNGAAVATWTDGPRHGHPRVRAALRRSNRLKFGPTETIDGPGVGGRGPDAAIAGRSAVIVWEVTRGENDDSAGVAAASRKAG